MTEKVESTPKCSRSHGALDMIFDHVQLKRRARDFER